MTISSTIRRLALLASLTIAAVSAGQVSLADPGTGSKTFLAIESNGASAAQGACFTETQISIGTLGASGDSGAVLNPFSAFPDRQCTFTASSDIAADDLKDYMWQIHSEDGDVMGRMTCGIDGSAAVDAECKIVKTSVLIDCPSTCDECFGSASPVVWLRCEW